MHLSCWLHWHRRVERGGCCQAMGRSMPAAAPRTEREVLGGTGALNYRQTQQRPTPSMSTNERPCRPLIISSSQDRCRSMCRTYLPRLDFVPNDLRAHL